MGEKLLYLLAELLMRVLTRVKVTGMENIPEQGACILAGNHLGHADITLMLHLRRHVARDDVIVVVAEKYRKYALLRWAVKELGFTFIDRFNPDPRALREVLQRLEAGGILVISPEGTRSDTRALAEGRPGSVYLAAKTGAVVIPAAITGTEDIDLKRRLLRLRRLQINAKIGKPFRIPPLPKNGRDQFLQTHTDEIMCRIAALLPPAYRGVYAKHPRLRSLLSEGGPG